MLRRLEGLEGFAEGGERGGGILAARPRPDGRAEHVVEVGCALRGSNRIAAADMRLIHETFVAALDQREAVPEEVLRSGGLGTARPTTVTVVRAGELAVDVVVVGVGLRALGDGQHLVEVAVAVGLVAFLDETASGVVGVARRHVVDDGEIRW